MAVADIAAAARRPHRALGLCFLAAVCEGFDIQSMGVAAPGLAPALALSRDQLGPAFSASLVGLLVGAVVLGALADRIGRKWTLVGSLAAYGVFSFATASAWNLPSLLAIRVLAGLGLGGAFPNLIALSAEAVGERGRGRTVTFVTAGMALGAAIAGAVAASLSWRGIFYVGGVGPLALAFVMAALLPESALFERARRASAAGGAARPGFTAILFGDRRGATTLLLWAAIFGALLTLYLLLNWLPTLMAARGVAPRSASYVSMLFNLGTIPGVLVLAPLLDRRRRAPTIAVWYCALALALVALAGARADLISSGAAGFAAGAFVGACPLMLYGLAPGFYPVVMRGAGVGAMVAVGRLGSIVGPLFAAALLSAGASAKIVLLALLPLVALAGVAALGLLTRPTTAD